MNDQSNNIPTAPVIENNEPRQHDCVGCTKKFRVGSLVGFFKGEKGLFCVECIRVNGRPNSNIGIYSGGGPLPNLSSVERARAEQSRKKLARMLRRSKKA